MNTLKSFYRGFFKEYRDLYKGSSFWIYIRYFLTRFMKEFYWQHRYAIRRMWSGYDDVDIFNFSSNVKERFLVLLIEFKKHNPCLFVDCELNSVLSKEETDDIIDKMIELLKFATRDEFEGTSTTEEIIEKYKESLKAFHEFLDMYKIWGEQINY